MHFGRPIKPQRRSVEFGDGVAENEQATTTPIDLLARSAASTATKVRWLLPMGEDD
ncbi:hypothetical protein ACIQGO_15645 [Streptomyces shenzhenensis]|uniref:hypothetical protein n=1 Tax=Streptomyces shenzhenensis TaxID=943815 RepID=UPI00380A6754